MLKRILITAVLAATCLSAQASVITSSDSFGTQNSVEDKPLGFLNETVSIDKFDASLGLLTSVTLTFRGQIDSIGSSQNVSDADGRAGVGIFLYNDWQVSNASIGLEHVFISGSTTSAALYAESSPENTFTLISGTNQDTFTYDLSTSLLSADYMFSDGLDMFVADDETGVLDFAFTTFANTNINNDVESGTGKFLNSFNSGTFGEVVVTYNYKESELPSNATAVSEPAMAGLMGLSLLLLGFKRRKRTV